MQWRLVATRDPVDARGLWRYWRGMTPTPDLQEHLRSLPIVQVLTRNPAPVPAGPVKPCATCRRFTEVTPEQVRGALGPYSHLPAARTGLARDVRIGYCPAQHELRGEDTGCEFWSGRVLGRLRAWGRRRMGLPDLDAALTVWLADRRQSEERERLEARSVAARTAVPEPTCSVCKREHPQCTVCKHRRPTCGVCPTCGLEGVVVMARPDGVTSWYCSRSPEHNGTGLPDSPAYVDGVCPGCTEQRRAAAELADWIETRAVGGYFTLADAVKASPLLEPKAVAAGLERLVKAGQFVRGAGVNVMGVGVHVYPPDQAARAITAKAARRAFPHPTQSVEVEPSEIIEFYVRVR